MQTLFLRYPPSPTLPRKGGGSGPSSRHSQWLSCSIIPRLAVIGCGLIGGSIARAAKASGAAKTVVVTDASADARKRVREIGASFADEVVETSADAVEGCRSDRGRDPGRRLWPGRR